jgi:hydrogenase maturation protein HypF
MLAAYGAKINSPFIETRLRQMFAESQLSVIHQQIEKNLNCVLTSSCGRLFDAAAALLAVCEKPTYEGQAAMQLEAIARKTKLDLSVPASTEKIIDAYAILERMAALAEKGIDAGEISYAFHRAVADEIARVCRLAAAETDIDLVCLSGGVMQNALLLSLLTERLDRAGLKIFKQRQVPPNDGGISLGQAIAGAAMAGRWHQ